jgi:hypothetical protein
MEAKVHGVWYRIFDNLSRPFLCSNDSKRLRMGRKSLRGMGMRGNLARGNGVCVRPAKARGLRQERSQDRILRIAGRVARGGKGPRLAFAIGGQRG